LNSDNPQNDILRLKGMRFFGYHGAFAEEKRLGGQFVVDLELFGDFSYENTEDDVRRTVDLMQVYKTVEEIVCDKRFNLIETLAEEIAEVILSGYGIDSVKVIVSKEQPPIPGVIDSIQAVVYREK